MVREALKVLAQTHGEVSSKIGIVIFAREDWQWWDPEVLSWACEGIPHYNFLQQLTEMRLLLNLQLQNLLKKCN